MNNPIINFLREPVIPKNYYFFYFWIFICGLSLGLNKHTKKINELENEILKLKGETEIKHKTLSLSTPKGFVLFFVIMILFLCFIGLMNG